ncbi:hypothetical protein Ciccas_013272 [Cichlidogyrus casuarinus]|uniref:Ankyrin repeat domain-containing protein 53 n=1 Tax=Cichlidogyrus casuarinus TaxID=1844966 RepID=A0ABD2PM41_9PLAT
MPEDIHIAAAIGDLLWLKQSAEKTENINELDSSAAGEGLMDCIELLLSYGARVDVYDNFGNLPLDLAKLWGHKSCVKLLKYKMWQLNKSKEASKRMEENRRSIFSFLEENNSQLFGAAKDKYFDSSNFYDWLMQVKTRHLVSTANREESTPRGKESQQNEKRKKVKQLSIGSRDSDSVCWKNSLHVKEFFAEKVPNLTDLYPRDPYTLEIDFTSTPLSLNPLYPSGSLYPLAGRTGQQLMEQKHQKNPFRRMYYRRKHLDDSPSYSLPEAEASWTIRNLASKNSSIPATLYPNDPKSMLYQLATLTD